MQLMIDIAVETPAAMRLCAQFLIDQAALRERADGEIPTGTLALVPAPPSAGDFSLADLQRAQEDINRPLAPPAPIAPPAPTATVPAISIATPTSAPAVAAPPAPVASNVVALPAATSGAVVAAVSVPDEFDSSGVPFDARIHQKTKGKKKDQTWKLQKGIADELVSAVMQELAPRIRKPGVSAFVKDFVDAPPLEVVSPALAPPPMPSFGAPLPAGVEVPPVGGHYINGVLQTPGAVAPVAPPAPAAPVAPAAPSAPALDPFRALVRKITDAKAAGRISVEEVSQCVANAGVPSLNLLNNMPHLISVVESNIDTVLALR
jgi:hypothetical protein